MTTATKQALQMKVLHKTFAAASIEALIAQFIEWRNAGNYGASRIGAMWSVTCDDVNVGDVSYNGRYWSAGERAAYDAKRAAHDPSGTYSARFIPNPNRKAQS